MIYVIGALQQKLPRAPLPFNPALISSTMFFDYTSRPSSANAPLVKLDLFLSLPRLYLSL